LKLQGTQKGLMLRNTCMHACMHACQPFWQCHAQHFIHAATGLGAACIAEQGRAALQVSVADLQLMQALTQLQELHLTNLRLAPCQRALVQLVTNLTSLTAFSLVGEQDALNGLVTVDLWAALCKLKALQRLACSRMPQALGTGSLESLTQLQVGASGATNLPSVRPLTAMLARAAPNLLSCSAHAKTLSPACLTGHLQVQHVCWALTSSTRATEAAAFSSMCSLRSVTLTGQQLSRVVLNELLCCAALRALDLTGVEQALELHELSQLVARCTALQQLRLAASGSAWVAPMVAFLLRVAATLPARVAKVSPGPEEFEVVLKELLPSRVGVARFARSEGREAAGSSSSSSSSGGRIEWHTGQGSEAGGRGADSGVSSDGWGSGTGGLGMDWEEAEVVCFSMFGAGGRSRLGEVVYERTAGDEYMAAYCVTLTRERQAGGSGKC
jgi:hypothetical protein